MRVDGISKTKYKKVEYCLRPPFNLLWELGYSTGLRISDMLKLTPKKINAQRPCITEQKTKKRKRLYIKKDLLKRINAHIEKYNIQENGKIFPFSRTTAWREIKKAGQQAGIEVNIGTHTMRKSYAKQYVCKDGKTITDLSKRLNHAQLSETIGYLTDNKTLGIKGKTEI